MVRARPGTLESVSLPLPAQLADKRNLIDEIRDRLLDRLVSLLYAALDSARNQVQVPNQFIEAA